MENIENIQLKNTYIALYLDNENQLKVTNLILGGFYKGDFAEAQMMMDYNGCVLIELERNTEITVKM